MEENSRRRFFRRVTVATLIGGLTLGIGAKAWAQGGHGYGHHGRGFMSGPLDPAKADARIERMVKHLAVEVDATPEQSAKLTAIAKSAAKDLQPMRAKVREARQRGMELLAAPTIDRAAIERLRSEQIQAADAASKRLSQALAESAEVLTPEQRVKLAQHFQQRRGGHRGGPRQRS